MSLVRFGSIAKVRDVDGVYMNPPGRALAYALNTATTDDVRRGSVRRVAPARLALRRSGVVDLNPVAGSGGDRPQVVRVRGHDQVPATYGSFDHASVDDVGTGGPRGYDTD